MSTVAPQSAGDPLETLIAECLRQQEEGEPSALERLCRQHPEHAPTLRARLADLAARGLVADAAPGRPVVGGFVVSERLGAGGMGEVWRAEQQGPLRRPVALKIIRRVHASSDEVLARFESERQALALMSHPAIAQVFAAGTTADGAPFFAMELIVGAPITQYCDAHHLNTRARVELFLEICRAVHHAHQRGVLHRDLKPGNILATETAGRPLPKIIDFGLAKALTEPLADRTLVTELGQILGTPEYMSPEQAELTERGVDTRTDVYSLGVVLYELLTGVLPLGSQLLREHGISELLRVIREVEPPRASARIQSLGADAGELAAARGTDAARLQRTLRGDLDWILDCALAKDRERRYATALDFARDLEHWLAGRPVQAGPPTAAYRFRKFVRRNRVAVAAGTTVLVVLIVALVVSTSFFLQSEHNYQQSEHNLKNFDSLAAIEEAEKHNQVARDDLWPMHPVRIPDFTQWLKTAEEELSRRPETTARLAAVRSRRLGGRYEQYRDVILDRSLERLLGAFDAMETLAADVRFRREWAASLRRCSIEDHAAAWTEAIATIRDRAQCPLYNGLELTPQLGLVPLARNEQGLYEFALLHHRLVLPQRTFRGAATSAWQIEPDTTFVLVLLPAGKLIMGAQWGDPFDRNYDPHAGRNEVPTNGMLLDAFFLSKYETTQGQWVCAGDDSNPSLWTRQYGVHQWVNPTHPVEQIAWANAVTLARRLGLVVPTEAQWEYGARGATRMPWGTTCDLHGLDAFANLRDATCKRAGFSYDWLEGLDDGWVVHAPIGSFRSNQFGLHDVIGNVNEWVREPHTDFAIALLPDPAHAGDGERPHDARDPNRLVRGGSYEARANQARVSFRLTMSAGPNATVGVRFARPLDPAPTPR